MAPRRRQAGNKKGRYIHLGETKLQQESVTPCSQKGVHTQAKIDGFTPIELKPIGN